MLVPQIDTQMSQTPPHAATVTVSYSMSVPSATLSVQISSAVHFSSLQVQKPDTEKKIPLCPLALVAQTCLDMSDKAVRQSIHVSGCFQVLVVFDIETAELLKLS